MPRSYPYINEDIHNLLDEVRSAPFNKGWSKSRTINYVLYLGLCKLKETVPSFSLLDIPTFDVDNPIRKPKPLEGDEEDEKEEAPQHPEEEKTTEEKIIEVSNEILNITPRSDDEVEFVFRNIKNINLVPESSQQIIKAYLKKGVQLDPDYDAEYSYDLSTILKNNKLTTSKYKWCDLAGSK